MVAKDLSQGSKCAAHPFLGYIQVNLHNGKRKFLKTGLVVFFENATGC
jgi:hypothetical protein